MDKKTCRTSVAKNKLLRALLLMSSAILLFFFSNAQSTQDTGIFYISPMVGLYTGSGTMAERFTPDVEFGKQWDVFSLGLDVGKIHVAQSGGTDTTFYLETRPSLNVFQQENLLIR